ncbi:MAG: glycosyltransferase family 2 protein [Acidobacteriia bacterium]|nr:glycosyltransferase family 2 protein [Terriglobia bacterium]
MDLSIICVNWNSLKYLQDCLTSVYEHTRGISFEVIVVDNASPEGGIDSIKSCFPQVTIIKSLENVGFASANNLGCRHAHGEYVLLLNPDTKLIGPTINILLGHIKQLPDAGIVGCKLLNTDFSVQISSIQKFPTILNQMLDAEYLRLRWPHCPLWDIGPLFSPEVKLLGVDVIPGACMLLRRSVFEQVGMLSEEYFMYAEDLDLNYKVRRAGFKNYYVGETAIIHHGGKSSSRQKVSQWVTIMQCRAMVRYFRKTRGRWYQWLYQASQCCMAIARLTILFALSLFGDMFWDKESLQCSSNKWKAVLRWALGRQSFVLQNH